MLKAGIDPKIVQERLGHTDIQTTLNIYSHVAPGMQRRAAEAFGRVIATDRLTSVNATIPGHSQSIVGSLGLRSGSFED